MLDTTQVQVLPSFVYHVHWVLHRMQLELRLQAPVNLVAQVFIRILWALLYAKHVDLARTRLLLRQLHVNSVQQVWFCNF